MGFRRFLATAALVVCGTGLMAGCPNLGGLIDSLAEGLGELDLGSDGTLGGTDTIADGTYSGTKNARTTFRQNGLEYWQGEWSEPVSLEFAKGAIVQPTGDWLNYGDTDALDLGDLDISREVDEIYFLENGGYEVYYALSATWGDVPFAGTEHVVHVAQADGSVRLDDLIDLDSLDSYDGGAWSILIVGEGALTASGEVVNPNPVNPGNPLDDDILDKKSGKIRR